MEDMTLLEEICHWEHGSFKDWCYSQFVLLLLVVGDVSAQPIPLPDGLNLSRTINKPKETPASVVVFYQNRKVMKT